MQTQERVPTRVPTVGPPEQGGSRRRGTWMVVVIGVLVLALIGLTTWVVLDRASTTPPDAAEMTSITDRMLTAWNGGDEAAIRSLYASDAVVEDHTIDVTFDGIDRIAYAAQLFYDVTFSATAASEVAVNGSAATVTYTVGPVSDPTAGVAFTTIEVNGDGTIQHQVIAPVEGVEALPPKA